MAKVRAKSERQIELMREAGAILACALDAVREAVVPGVTTAELDSLAETVIRDHGAVPSFKGYLGFPSTICASVDEEIVHGIPGPRVLQEGQVISVDCGTIWKKYQGDSAITIPVGEIAEETRRLLAVTQASLDAGIAAARHGAHLGDVSHAIEMAARDGGFEVIREYGGHGIGRHMHEQPNISNWGPAGQGIELQSGMTLALEPMVSAGGYETTTLDDGWTVVTVDGSITAHFEHTVVVTENGAEILTRIG